MIQNETGLFFHTDNSIIRIAKDTLEKSQVIVDDESKIWYDNLTYSKELNVLIGGYFQGKTWYIAVLNPDTMEVIQIVPGYGFTDSSYTMGTIVANQKVFYLNTIDEKCNVMSLTVGQKPEIVYSTSTHSITSGSLSGELLYLLGHNILDQEAKY
ncbi:MAG: hypothetical protein KAH01_07555, partial [Caldisericia bacterium]|nr:hypothetical protein [Caldisericia bacterium]